MRSALILIGLVGNTEHKHMAVVVSVVEAVPGALYSWLVGSTTCFHIVLPFSSKMSGLAHTL